MSKTDGGLAVHPVTPQRWPDLVELFERPGPRGAWSRTGACYCMFWRLPPAEYEENFRQRSMDSVTGGPNKEAMAGLVGNGEVPGLIAYRDDEPVGWVSVTPRPALARLEHVRNFDVEREDTDTEPWSIACFYIYRSDQRAGVATRLLDAAVEWASEHGATSVEGYPVKAGNVDPYTGFDLMFDQAGFSLVEPGRGRGRALWRLALKPSQ